MSGHRWRIGRYPIRLGCLWKCCQLCSLSVLSHFIEQLIERVIACLLRILHDNTHETDDYLSMIILIAQ